jgi:hypothetical protein
MTLSVGGRPLPTRLGCRACSFETEQRTSHARARADLRQHIETAHPELDRDILARAGRRLDETASSPPGPAQHPVSGACEGECCTLCGRAATHKLGEEILFDDPSPVRHPLTAYVCCTDFGAIMHVACGDPPMPTIRSIPTHPLTARERPSFVAWATSRPGFRPGASSGVIPELGGAYLVHHRPVPLQALVARWRELGSPVRSTRRRRATKRTV